MKLGLNVLLAPSLAYWQDTVHPMQVEHLYVDGPNFPARMKNVYSLQNVYNLHNVFD